MGLPTRGKPRPPTLLPSISPMRDEDPSCSPHKAQHLQKHLWSCYAKKNNPTVQRTSPGLDPHLVAVAELDSGGAHPSRGAMLSKGTRERTTHRGGQPPGNREYFALEGGDLVFFCPFLSCPFAVGLLQPPPAAKPPSRVPAARRRCAPRRLIPDVSGSFPSQTQVWIPFQSPPVQPCIFPVD